MTSSFRTLRVRIPADGLAGAPLDWVALDATGRPMARGATPLPQLPAATELELVVPARRLVMHQLELPPAAGKHETAVIRQQLEDRVLGDLADCHIVRGERQGNRLAVWLVSRDWLLGVLSACRAAERLPARVYGEQSLLPAASFAATPDGFVYRASSGSSGTLPEEALLEPVCGEPLTRIDDLLAAPLALRLDLLPGLPLPRRGSQPAIPLLKLAGALLTGIAMLHLLSLVLTWRQLASQEAGLREAIRQGFAAAHPGLPIVDPILQWRQLHGRQAAAQDGDALDQLSQLAAGSAVAIRPQRIEADANGLKITLSTSDANLLKPALQSREIPFESHTTDKGLEQLTLPRPPGAAR